MCQNTTMRVNGAWIKGYCILCSKTYNILLSSHNFHAGLRQATRGAHICEMSLLSGIKLAAYRMTDIDALLQNCSNSNALPMDLLQSCAKPLIYNMVAYRVTDIFIDILIWMG